MSAKRTGRLLAVVAGAVAVLGVLGVVSAAFALSFDAIRAVAVAAHIRPSLAWLFPVAVDGAMSVATVCAVVLRARGRSAAYPWLVVLFGAAVSVVANGLHAWVDGGAVALPGPWAVTLSAVPPVLLALSIHLLIVLALSAHQAPVVGDSGTATEPATEPAKADAMAPPVGTPDQRQEAANVGDSGTATEPATEPAKAAATVPPKRTPKRTPRRTPKPRQSNAERVAAAVALTPDATVAELAARLKLSERTVQRYRPAAKAAAVAAASAPSVNGHPVIDGEVTSNADD